MTESMPQTIYYPGSLHEIERNTFPERCELCEPMTRHYDQRDFEPELCDGCLHELCAECDGVSDPEIREKCGEHLDEEGHHLPSVPEPEVCDGCGHQRCENRKDVESEPQHCEDCSEELDEESHHHRPEPQICEGCGHERCENCEDIGESEDEDEDEDEAEVCQKLWA